MKRVYGLFLATILALAAAEAPAATGSRVKVTGEVIDSWCYLTEIMYPLGTAHHQCALWCAVGGIPVGLLDDKGNVHVLLEVFDETANVAPQGVLTLQSHRVTFEGQSIERDGVKYLLVDKLVEDQGIVNQTHQENGIQPFGN